MPSNKHLLMILIMLHPVLLLELSRFFSQYPMLDDFYYHGAAVLSASIAGKLDQSLYSYYSYPTAFIIGAIFHEISGLDMFIFADIYSIFTSIYIGLVGFLMGKHIFNDFFASSLFSLLSTMSAYYFPRWFSPFSISSVITLTLLYCILVLCNKRDSRRSLLVMLLIPSCVLAHLPNSSFFLSFLLAMLLILPFNQNRSKKLNKYALNENLHIPIFIVIFAFCLFLTWNLFIYDFIFARFVKETVNTILNPPVEEVVWQFTEVYFKRYNPFTVLKRIYLLSFPLIGSMGALFWFFQRLRHREYANGRMGILALLFVAQYLFISLNVVDYLIRFGFTEGYGISARTRWLLYLISAWWTAILLLDVIAYLNRKLHDSNLRKKLLLIVVSALFLSSITVSFIISTESTSRIVCEADIDFNLFLARFLSVNSNLHGYMSQNSIFYYLLVYNYDIRYANMANRGLISMPESIHDYTGGVLDDKLKEMNVLIVTDINRAKLIYPGLEGAIDKMFSSFKIDRVAVIFDNRDHKFFLKGL